MTKDGFHQRGTVVLNCRHSVILLMPLPAKGEEQYCRRCNEYRIVQDSHDSYVVKCGTGKCRLAKNVGADKNLALVTARQHVARYSRHRVTIFSGWLSIAEVTNTEETLFVTAEERNVIAAESKNLLRNLGLGTTAKPGSMG